jgi:hypothetical protein
VVLPHPGKLAADAVLQAHPVVRLIHR